jgi:drug/metabolite transporter (DMT)-like permease
MSARRQMLTGMASALAAFLLFSFGDALVRSAAGQWPGTAMAALRYGAAALGLGAIVAAREGRKGFAWQMPLVQLGRGTAVAFAGGAFFVALGYMPLADATAIQFTAPIWTALISAIFLGERVGRLSLLLIVLAFAGVLVVLQPNVAAFGLVALLPLLAALCMSLLMILNRRAGGNGSLLLNQFLIAAVAAAVLLPITILGDVSGISRLAVGVPPASVLVKCLIVAVTGTLGHLLLYVATLRAPAAVIAPMGYAQMLSAMMFGLLLFGDTPRPSMLLGAAMIIGAGLALIRVNLRSATSATPHP